MLKGCAEDGGGEQRSIQQKTGPMAQAKAGGSEPRLKKRVSLALEKLKLSGCQSRDAF